MLCAANLSNLYQEMVRYLYVTCNRICTPSEFGNIRRKSCAPRLCTECDCSPNRHGPADYGHSTQSSASSPPQIASIHAHLVGVLLATYYEISHSATERVGAVEGLFVCAAFSAGNLAICKTHNSLHFARSARVALLRDNSETEQCNTDTAALRS